MGFQNQDLSTMNCSLQPDSKEVRWCSSLPAESTDSLDQLLFHNPNQGIWNEFLEATIARVGSPVIHTRSDGRIFIELETPGAVQSLVAVFDSEPVGAVVYSRMNESLRVLFLAVHEEWTLVNRGSDAIFFQVIDRLDSIAQRIAGIQNVVFFPGSERELRFKVKKRNGKS